MLLSFFFHLYGKYRTISFKNASQLRKSTCDLKIQKGICRMFVDVLQELLDRVTDKNFLNILQKPQH